MFRLRSQYIECKDCTSKTIDEDDYNAMLEWFDKNDMQPGINPQSADMVNYALVQQWIEFSSSNEQQEIKKINLAKELAQEFL